MELVVSQSPGPDRSRSIGAWLLLSLGYLLVFATGASGLIYEVTWQRYLSRLLGSDATATGIIIGCFLGGLAVGYFLCGRLSARVASPLRTYAVLEAVIGGWALIFPELFGWFAEATLPWSFASPWLILVQGVAAGIVLTGVPTICMGATVPMLTRGLSRSLGEATAVHARVYGINTAGGFCGTLCAGFWLIPVLGLPVTMLSTSLLNLTAAAYFFLWGTRDARREPSPTRREQATEPADPPPPRPGSPLPRPVLYLVALLSGFSLMTLENVLIRFTSTAFGSSSYTFSLVLSVFLVAIAAGSYAVSRLRRLPRGLLYANQLAMTILLLLLYLSLDVWPYLAHLVRIGFQGNGVGFALYHAAIFLLLALLLFLPMALAGATVPLTFHELKRELGGVGQESGQLLAWNTIGDLAGSLIGGIVLFHLLDSPRVFLVAVAFAAASALLAALRLPLRHRLIGVAVLLVPLWLLPGAPLFQTERFALGTFLTPHPVHASFAGPAALNQELLGTSQVLELREDPTCRVAVLETVKRDEPHRVTRAISINGKSDSSTLGDAHTLRLSAHYPALLAARRKDALVIGLATGVTAGELTLYPELERLEVAEISPAVVDVLPRFDPDNHRLRSDPRLRLIVGDAFRVLGRSDHGWDIIISEPSNPWTSGVDMLFTEEYYRLVRSRLQPGGVFLQWAQAYSASTAMFGLMANTLLQVFPEVHVFMASGGDLLFVARPEPFTRADLLRAEQVLASHPRVQASLAELELTSLEALLLREHWTGPLLRDSFSGAGVQTLDNPRLHFLAGRDFFAGQPLPLDELFPGLSSFHRDGYLLLQLHPDWDRRVLGPAETAALIRSTRSSFWDEREWLKAATFIELKAFYDRDPTLLDRHGGEAGRLVRLAAKPADQAAWDAVGLGHAPLRTRVETLLRHLATTRSWIFTYPLDGLRALLREGMARAATPEEHNGYALRLIRLTLLEQLTARDPSALKLLRLDQHGTPLLAPEDHALLEEVVSRSQRQP